ncbi:Esterase YbfF [Roseobacter fucihabitans]|uniref:Esterase YbfF n=1 Tax=Roseobacter fucihabitans TaxID=1537242 RepID=A0ABZ2BXI5_9RHOB|nr:alpha/beta fold hydrolase [Roseobacter litoralis]MBC6964605.1 Esterase YbfF [Roseobacter litoralis]
MLSYSEFGAPDAPKLVIVHGLYGSGRNWGVIAKRLCDVARVITVDQRNHGQSAWTKTHTYSDMADDLVELIQHLGGPVDVIGHSMGGKAAMVLAVQNPELIRRLIVGDIAPVPYTHSQMQFITAMRAVDLSNLSRRSDAEAQLGALGVEPALQSFFTQSLDVAERRWRLNLDVLALEMDRILSFPTLSGAFEGPTLFLSGAASDYVTAEHRPAIKSLFPKARFAKLPQAGHWLHAEKPREFEAAVRAFLALQT